MFNTDAYLLCLTLRPSKRYIILAMISKESEEIPHVGRRMQLPKFGGLCSMCLCVCVCHVVSSSSSHDTWFCCMLMHVYLLCIYLFLYLYIYIYVFIFTYISYTCIYMCIDTYIHSMFWCIDANTRLFMFGYGMEFSKAMPMTWSF